MVDLYYIIEKPSVDEIKIKGSRFIAQSDIASSVDEAMEKLNIIRKREYSATHNCYAYVTGENEEQRPFKFSDDGEPNGTAGRPIYDAICGRKLTNILLVVTRYFGGTKLGTGGLVRAYSQAAGVVLDKSGRIEKFITDKLKVLIEFPLYDKLIKLVHNIGARQNKADFSEHVTVELEIRKSKTESLIAGIIELSGGKAKIEKI
ncbi:MAG: IMPACT family protein [Candidatus Zixiibacteriota bacterium]